MRRMALLIGLCCGWIMSHAQHQSVFPHLSGATLLDSLVVYYKTQTVLDYDQARDTLFAKIYVQGDSVEGVYTGHRLYLPTNVDPSTALYRSGIADGINTEHTYPQSKGARYGAPKSDMHHLYPTRTGANSARSNYPFAEIALGQTTFWYYRSSVERSPSQNPALYSQLDSNSMRFGPRPSHRGNAARAIFYFYTMYKQEADDADPSFFALQVPDLCQWHLDDPVDSLEWVRTYRIASYQDGKPNPFVLDCTLPMRTYCPHLSAGSCVVSTTELEQVGIQWEPPYPQPASAQVTFRYVLDQGAEVHWTLYNALGQLIDQATVLHAQAGAYEWTWDKGQQPDGCYFYRCTIAHKKQSHAIGGRLLFGSR